MIPLYTSYKLQDRCLMNNTPLIASAGHSPYYASTTSSSSSRMLVASRKEDVRGKCLSWQCFYLRLLAHHGPLVLPGSGPSLHIVRERTTVVSQWEHETRPSKNLIYKLERALLISTYTSVTATLHIITTTLYTSCRDFPRCGTVGAVAAVPTCDCSEI